ncbi:unnamed protein product [Orchesella dallaii]|uniref:Endothelin-converting enzyme 1 n=1 Tax=Orchesella dallaii TaxID=48710 RepID=A0ABP1QWZ6_9HEXA
MSTTDSQTSQNVQISIPNVSFNEKERSLGKRVLRRSCLFIIGCVIGAAITCAVFVFFDPRGNDASTLGKLLDSQTDAHAHTMNCSLPSRNVVSEEKESPKSIVSNSNQQTSQNSGGRGYQSNVFQSIHGPCDNVPVKQFGKDLCTSQPCMESACDLATSINMSVDPCENFYEFACQGWLSKNVRPSYSPKWIEFSKMEKSTSDTIIGMLNEPEKPDDMPAYKLAKSFFKKCSDVDELDRVGLQPLWDILEKYGGWPMLYEEGKWNSSNFDWMKSMADLKKFFGTSAILDLEINPNQYNSTIKYNTILVQQPSLFIARPYLMDHENYSTAVVAYRDFITSVAKELLKFSGTQNINETYLKEQASEVIDFESVLANLTRDAVGVLYDRRNHRGTTKLNFLQQAFDNYTTENATNLVHFPTLLNNLYANTGVNISEDELISLSDINYMGGIFGILALTPESLLANYLHFRMAAVIVSYTTKPMRNYVSEFHNKMYGISDTNARHLYRAYTCSATAQEIFPMPIGFEYLKRYKGNANLDLKEVKDMFENIRGSFRELLYNAEWMNGTVRNTSLDKLEKIVPCLGYPDWITNVSKIQLEFDGLILNQTIYFNQLLAVNAWLTERNLKTLRKSLDPGCKWLKFPGHAGPYYDHKMMRLLHLLDIPLGVINKPFFDRQRPLSLNYGSLGTIIGHEITHGFTIPSPGWTEESNGELSAIGKCLINQYDQYHIKELQDQQIYLNGKLTFMENFPDSAGLLESYKAYKLASSKGQGIDKKLPGLDKFTPEQLYFLGFASNWCAEITKESLREQILTDYHSPEKYRAIGTLRNSKEFAEAWSCPVGSFMNPSPTDQEKCSVF